MYFPELEQFATENPKWRDWITTVDQVLERNLGRVLSIAALSEFVPASEKQLDELLEVLCLANRIARLDWLCCSLHESVLFDPAEPNHHCDLCGKKVATKNLKHAPSVRIFLIVIDLPDSKENPNVPDETSPKVFISYSHDSEPHKQQVLDLAQQLRVDGIDVAFDRFVQSPPEGWPLWMLRQIDWADYVLCVFSERYNHRCLGTEKPGEGKGVAWESTMMFNALYGNPHFNAKFIPIVFDSQDEKWIIQPMQGFSRFRIQELDLNALGGYQDVYRLITKQPAVTPAGIGTVHKLPPAKPLVTVQQTYSPSPSSPALPTTSIMDESELRKRLGDLLPSMFDSIVADMGADGYVQGQNAPTVSRAIELVKFAKAKGELNRLIDLYLEIISPK